MTDDHRTRITEVIGTHEVWQRPDRTWECSCGRTFALKVDYDAHVADVLIHELGLAAEGCIPSKDGSKPWYTCYRTPWEATYE